MATYAELKQDVKDLINRTDCTDALAGTFINQAQRKIARTLRIPSLEKSQTITVGTTPAPSYTQATGKYALPNDFLELVYIYTDKRILDRVPLRQFIALDRKYPATGEPRYYTRKQAAFEFKPIPLVGDEVTVVYYADPVTLVNATDTNIFSEVCPDLITYGAVLFASDYFNDQRKATFEDTYNKLFAETKALSDSSDEAMVDSAVQPSFEFEQDLLN